MNRQTKILIAITAAICMIMFAAGLKPKGFRFHNTISWLTGQNGISFGKWGIAYTDKNQSPSGALSPEALSIELIVTVPRQYRNHLDVIFDFWDDHCPRHVALCQWDSTLMVMKSPSRFFKNSRLHLGKSVSPTKVCFVTITSRRNHGTDLSINGILLVSTNRFDLCDSNASLGRLTLGCSPSANNPWRGEVHKLSVYDKAFSKAEILERYQQWVANQPTADTEVTLASYTFDEKSGDKVRDHSGKLGDLCIPSRFFIPQKQILSMPWEDFWLDTSFASDVAINLAGFIPFGLFFSTFLWSIGGFTRRHRIVMSILVGGGLSLFFELVQVYIPTRSSQMSDLVLNCVGTFIGAMIASLMLRYTNRFRRCVRATSRAN